MPAYLKRRNASRKFLSVLYDGWFSLWISSSVCITLITHKFIKRMRGFGVVMVCLVKLIHGKQLFMLFLRLVVKCQPEVL